MTKQVADLKNVPARESEAIRPFKIEVPDAALADLRERLARTRWPDQIPGTGWEYGIPIDYLRELVEYWRDSYDWRTHEAALNRFDHHRADIDGQPIHFLHARSPHTDALPLLVTHGWPGSIVEFLDAIPRLTRPELHGGALTDAFHVVAPSLPGYGFSGPTRAPGWTPSSPVGTRTWSSPRCSANVMISPRAPRSACSPTCSEPISSMPPVANVWPLDERTPFDHTPHPTEGDNA